MGVLQNCPTCTIGFVIRNETCYYLIIWSFTKLVNMFKIQATGPAGLEFRTGSLSWVWDNSTEFMLESWRWLYFSIGCRVWCGADRWWPATGLGAGPTRLWMMVNMVRCWSLYALLHLSCGYLFTFSDREAWEQVGFERSWGHPVSHWLWFGTLFNNPI